MKVLCAKYPELHIHDLGVRFRDGAAEVTDAVTKKLAAMPAFDFEFAKPAENAPVKGGGKRDRAGKPESPDT